MGNGGREGIDRYIVADEGKRSVGRCLILPPKPKVVQTFCTHVLAPPGTDFGPNYFPMGLSLLYEKPEVEEMSISKSLWAAFNRCVVVITS